MRNSRPSEGPLRIASHEGHRQALLQSESVENVYFLSQICVNIFSWEEFDFLNRVVFKPGNLQQARLVVHGKPGEFEREVIFVV